MADLERCVGNLYVMLTGALGLLSGAAFVVAVVMSDAAATVLFTHATVNAAIAFHLFAVGNAAYSCAASLGDDGLFRLATEINENGVSAAAGSGAVLFSAILWQPVVVAGQPMVPWVPQLLRWALLLAGVAVEVLVALCGVWRQRHHCRWYEYVRSVVLRQRGGEEWREAAS